MDQQGRRRMTMAALLVVTFLAGALAGAAGDRLLHAEHPRRHGPVERGQWKATLFDDLDLTAGQRERVEAILESRRPRVEAVWDSVKPHLRSQIDSTNAEIRAVLTPEQRTVFDRRLEDRKKRFRFRLDAHRGER